MCKQRPYQLVSLSLPEPIHFRISFYLHPRRRLHCQTDLSTSRYRVYWRCVRCRTRTQWQTLLPTCTQWWASWWATRIRQRLRQPDHCSSACSCRSSLNLFAADRVLCWTSCERRPLRLLRESSMHMAGVSLSRWRTSPTERASKSSQPALPYNYAQYT